MFRLYGWSFVLSQNSRVSWRRKKKRWRFMCVSLNNRQLESYPLNVLLSLYSLHPSKLVIPLCILCTRIYSCILQILALPENLELFKSYESRILLFFFFFFFFFSNSLQPYLHSDVFKTLASPLVVTEY